MTSGRVKPDSGLNLREKPNGKKIGVLTHNEQVEILEEVLFYRVRTSDGQLGYVHGDFLDESPEPVISPDDLTVDATAFPEPEFQLVTFTGSQFIGKEVRVDRDFIPSLERVNNFARDCDVRVWVTSAIRNLNDQVNGAIVPPASKSCHHIGHAIDMNVQFQGVLYNSTKLKRSAMHMLPEAVSRFLNLVRADETLRWGGDFPTEDPVHIDDDFYHKQELMYQAKLQSRVNQLNA